MASCLQKTRKAGCDGPYTKSSCADCQKLEGKCQKTVGKKLLPNCTGPFSGVVCDYCKKLQSAGDLLDPDMLKWIRGLGLDSVVLERIYRSDCQLTPAQIDNKVAITFDAKAPWVKIGNLYTSVTVTGNNSWKDLVDKLYGEGKRDYLVFTGRHGQMSGTIVEDQILKTIGAKVPDEEHLTQDKIKKVEVEKTYKTKGTGDVNITLCNVGTTPDTTMSKTKRLAAQCLSAGDDQVVIFAWCYSLLSFYTTTEALDKATRYKDIACYNTKISKIVAEKFGWAEVLETRTAYLSKARSPEKNQDYVKWSHMAAVTM